MCSWLLLLLLKIKKLFKKNSIKNPIKTFKNAIKRI